MPVKLDAPGLRGIGRSSYLPPDAGRTGRGRPPAPRAPAGERDEAFAVILAACRARLEAQERRPHTWKVGGGLPAPVLEAARLARLGLGPPAIARQMGRSLGEVELLLGLARATGQLR